MLIEKFTPEQESKIPFYVEKWTKIGHSTERINLDVVKPLLLSYLKPIKIRPKNFVLCDSPLACQKAINAQVKRKNHTYYPIHWYLRGGLNAGYCAFYDFIISEILQPDKPTMKLWNIFKEISTNLHCFWVFDTHVFLSQRPTEIHFEGTVLHNNNDASVKYADGFSLYTIHGVRVTKEIVTTPADKIPISWILNEKNAQVRAELITKIGIERLIKESNAKLLHRKGLYELYNVTLDDPNRRWPYLKMINPSTEEIHFEGVEGNCSNCERNQRQKCPYASETGCDTVPKALFYRNGTIDEPIIIT